ncbi:Shikimate kinase I [Roseibacterium elongatum DSM 19469]|uniref:Shikimate kinase n=1 Tax=Roseicyclus elongatus DSM 19469 TaxID=1294273 RepID=W8RUS0_9RHOB|nr:shikimate kinase [Roseibacterium elongatum]AHM04978.1 Shikimate kinase I [Roseibacterium elongatum DSM 19469]
MGETVPETQQRLRRTIVLIGMMGSGKTAIGRALAARLDAPLKDSDAEIVEAAQLSIAEIFERFGEGFFREKETQVIARLLDGAPSILSTGGGAWLAARNRAMLTETATVLWLDAGLDLLWSRVRHKTTRPLLRTANPKATLTEIFHARQPIYALAPLRLRVDPGWSIDQTADAVLDILIDAGAVVTQRKEAR